MRRNRRTVLIGAVLGVALTACSGDGGTDTTASMPPPAGEAGAAVFARNCSACHQADLSGGTGPALGADSPAASAPLDDLRNTIENGGAGMPAWSGLLTEAEIDAVVAYLAEAQGR